MALQVRLRHDPAATWTSNNPVLAIGEPGVETDTGQLKIGDGSTAWNSLAYQTTTGPTQTAPYRSFGDGSDGTVTISSGTTTLTRDMYYNNLTMSGSGILITSGFKVFVKTLLDLKNAAAGAIQWNGNNGGNASAATGGSAPAAQTGGTIGDIATGGAGTTATTANGTGGSGGVFAGTNGGVSGAGGGGGTGTSGGGGGGGAARTPAINNVFLSYRTNFLNGITLISGGAGGSGGGAGAGDGTNNGGGGGAGGSGGGLVAIYANAIVKSSSTPKGVIQANGGNGGTGGNTSAGVTGGGGGGSGGGGGWVYIVYNNLYGPSISQAVQANGGNGAKGGDGTGSGATGGSGGNAGSGGRINILNVPLGTGNNLLGISNTTQMPELVGYTPVAATTSVVLTGGNGGFNGMRTATL